MCIVEDGGNTNAQNADGITPLHDAVQRKDQSIIKMLLDCNADVSLAAHSGYVTALFLLYQPVDH